MIYGVNT